MNRWKRWLAALLTVFVLASALPVTALATELQSQAPAAAGQTSEDTGAPPDDTGGTPDGTGGTPGDTGGTPGDTGGTPDGTGGTPGSTGGTPGDTGGTPDGTGGTPGDTGGTPGDTGQMPGDTGGTPDNTGGTPDNTGGTPGETGGTPDGTGGTPGETGQTLEEPPEIVPNSLLPLDEYSASLDLTGYLPGELKAVPVTAVIENLVFRYPNQSYTIPEDAVISWVKGGYSIDSDNYVTIKDRENGTMDLSPEYDSDREVNLELIVGTADPLDSKNVRIRVEVSITPQDELLEFTAYATDRTEIQIYEFFSFIVSGTSWEKTVYRITVNPEDWTEGQAYLSVGLAEELDQNGLTATVYQGLYSTEKEAQEDNAAEIKDIWNQSNMPTNGGHLADYSFQSGYEGMPEVTLVLKRNGITVGVLPFALYMYTGRMSLSYNGCLYADGGEGNHIRASSWPSYSSGAYVYTLEPDYPVEGQYYLGLTLRNPDPEATGGGANGINWVTKAAVGNYATLAEAQDASDIREQLFSDPASAGGGYLADFSEVVTFTVFTENGQVLHYSLRVVAGEEEPLPLPPSPLSGDTYFRMSGAASKQKNGNSSDYYDAYVMSYEDDSYYYNGYQTVFLLDDGSGIADGTAIYPIFYQGSQVDVFAGQDVDGQTAGATKQESGVTSVTFQNGKAISYSAAAEDSVHLKNYWVTFVTKKTGGPALFVNGTNCEDHYDEEAQLPVREVFLTEEYDYHHDVFFANIGDEALTGLSVTLSEDARNVALDDYWRVSDTKTLNAFTSTESSTWYGELSNVSKIRLVPERDEAGNILAGEVSGTLTIRADNIDPVVILLKGTAGTPKITTETVLDGVRYVPYSSLIQTNNMYDPGAVTFTLESGSLPAGIELLTNGELYGVPQDMGTFSFTVSAAYEGTQADTKEFTLVIEDNTNENVWNYDQSIWKDNTYQITTAIPNQDGSVSAPAGTNVDLGGSWEGDSLLFVTAGDYASFEAVWLDGVKLTEGAGADYISEEGSTRITIRTQTLRDAGNGTHTFAAEFRDENDNLRRAAQNYELTSIGTSGGSGGGGGVTGGGSSGGGGATGGSSGSSSSSGGSTSYRIEVEQPEGGSLTSNHTSASRGDTVTVTVTPKDGYVLEALIVTDSGGNRLTVSDQGNNRYRFTMPAGRVSIQAVFEKISEPEPEPEPEPGEEPAPDLPFADVKADDWFAPYVTDVYQRELMTGTTADSFAPGLATSRGMIVTILHRLENSPVAEGTYFSDVPLNQFYTTAAAWAAENGIVSGYGDGRFGPNDPVSREQIVMILMRYAVLKGMDVSGQADLSQFHDQVDLSEEAVQAMAWACAKGLINGKGNGILDPQGQATRAEVAAIFSRFCQIYGESDE